MRVKKYRIKELSFFKDGCNIDFLRSLRSYRCYVTEENQYIAVMQFDSTYEIVLNHVIMTQKDGSIKQISVSPIVVQIDKKYSLYEIEE